MNVLPTSKVMTFARTAPQAVLMLHIGKVLVDIGVVDSIDDYCINWLDQSPYLFQVPPEFIWLDDEMRESLIVMLAFEMTAANDLINHAKSKEDQDPLYTSLRSMGELLTLIEAIPKLY